MRDTGRRWLRLTASVLVGALAGGGLVATSGTAGGCATGVLGCAGPGELVEVAIGDLHPTQAVLGHDEVHYKLGRYRADRDEVNKRFDDWCEANGQGGAVRAARWARLDDPTSFTCQVPVGRETPATLAEVKTVVVGPGGVAYLTDGHHSLTALRESPDGGDDLRIRVRVAANYGTLDPATFWARMREEHRVWLRDAEDRPIGVDRLPAHLGLAWLADDPYRGLVFFTRDVGYRVPDDAPEFLEFYWGSWLRREHRLDRCDLADLAAYRSAVKRASKAMSDLAADDPVGAGLSAGDLGRMKHWNDGKKAGAGEFGRLSEPLTSPEPGKLAYALDHRGGVAGCRS